MKLQSARGVVPGFPAWKLDALGQPDGGNRVGGVYTFWPAVLLPILKIEQLGLQNESSLLGGTLELLRHGNWFVGGVVLLFSIVFPLTKIVLLLELSLLEVLHERHKATTLRWMEHLGKWSMMDVMLLAFLVMLVKLGDMVEFHFGPAIFAFVFCVAMSMIASLTFDPHAIWEKPRMQRRFEMSDKKTRLRSRPIPWNRFLGRN